MAAVGTVSLRVSGARIPQLLLVCNKLDAHKCKLKHSPCLPKVTAWAGHAVLLKLTACQLVLLSAGLQVCTETDTAADGLLAPGSSPQE